MADAGVGEMMLISAAIGGGSAAATGQDPLKGALLGGALGGLGAGFMGAGAGAGAIGGEAALTGAEMLPGMTQGQMLAAQTAGMEGFSQAPMLAAQTAGMGAAPTASGIGLGNWYSPFFKTGEPNTGGITDFWKSMNLPGQAATVGLGGLAAKEFLFPKVKMPTPEKYTGPLSKFRYDPSTFTPYAATPNIYSPGYAEGGIAALAQGGFNAPTGPVERMSQQTIGAGGMYPQSQMDKTYFATPTQMPASAEVIGADYDARTNPYTGVMMASGGIADLGGYSDGGRMLKGPGDGMSDSIPGVIEGKQPARLADGEFVVPADVVSHLGNGSTDAGAKRLYGMMDKVRKARTGTKKQGRQIKPEKYMPA